MLQLFFTLVIYVGWAGLAWLLGVLVIRKLEPPDAPPLEQFLIASAVGWGMLVVWATVLTFAGLLYVHLAVGSLVLLGVLALAAQRREIAPRLSRLYRDCRTLTTQGRASLWMAATLGALCLVYLGSALTPEVRHDPLDYHLAFPLLYVMHHGWYETPWHACSYLSYNVEMLYTLSLLISAEPLPKLIHWGFGVLTLLGTLALARRQLGTAAGLGAALIVAVQPEFSRAMRISGVELAAAFWTVVGVLMVMRWQDAERLPHRVPALLAGAFLGWALGCKYTVLPFVMVPVAIAAMLALKRRMRVRAVGRLLLWSAFAALIAFSPWWGRNLALTGDPIYPLFADRIGGRLPSELRAEFATQFTTSSLTGFPRQTVVNFIDHLGSLSRQGHSLFYLFLSSAVAALIVQCRGRKVPGRPLWFLLAPATAYLIFYLIAVVPDTWYFLPMHPLTACGCVTGLMLFPARKRWPVSAALVLLLALQFLYNKQLEQDALRESLLPVPRGAAWETYLDAHIKLMPLIREANRRLPPDAMVVGLGYPLHRTFLHRRIGGFWPWPTGPDFESTTLPALRQNGVTHFLAPTSVLDATAIQEALEDGELVPLLEHGIFVLYAIQPAREAPPHPFAAANDLSLKGEVKNALAGLSFFPWK